MPKDSLLICRQFDKKYDDTYRTIEEGLIDIDFKKVGDRKYQTIHSQ